MLMGVPGLTLYHLKSYLQKYRLTRNLQVQASQVPNKSGSTVFAERFPEISGALTNGTNPFHTNPGLQKTEALEMQIEVQRRLHEQLEVVWSLVGPSSCLSQLTVSEIHHCWRDSTIATPHQF